MIDLSGVASHCKDDGFLELPRLFFALDDRFPASMHETVTELSAALRDDIVCSAAPAAIFQCWTARG
jgi:hypothetical protein